MENRSIEFFKQNETLYARFNGQALSLYVGHLNHLNEALRGVADYLQWAENRLDAGHGERPATQQQP